MAVYDFTDPAQTYFVGRDGVAEEDNRITANKVVLDFSKRTITASDTATVMNLPNNFMLTGCTLRCLTKDASFKTAVFLTRNVAPSSAVAVVKSAACASVATIIGKVAGVGSSAATTAILAASNTTTPGAKLKLNPGAAADTFKGVLTVFGYTEKNAA
jgi:hypothetical protein